MPSTVPKTEWADYNLLRLNRGLWGSVCFTHCRRKYKKEWEKARVIPKIILHNLAFSFIHTTDICDFKKLYLSYRSIWFKSSELTAVQQVWLILNNSNADIDRQRRLCIKLLKLRSCFSFFVPWLYVSLACIKLDFSSKRARYIITERVIEHV